MSIRRSTPAAASAGVAADRSRRRARRPDRLPGPPLPDRAARPVELRRLFRRLPRRSSSRDCVEAHRVLAPTGSLYFHIDYREVHYCKVLLDRIFGRASFSERDHLGLRLRRRARRRRWPAKHDNILVYVQRPAALLLRPRRRRARALHGARAWSGPRKPRAASARRTRGGTPSCQPDREREDRLPERRNRSAFCGASCGRRRRPMGSWWISSPAAARRASRPTRRGVASCWSTTTPRPRRRWRAASRRWA